MVSLERIDEVNELLDEICEELPSYAFEHLNGGITLSEEVKYHPESHNEDLLILGQYERSILGLSITIFYGSVYLIYGYLDREDLKDKLRHVLFHEFTHHLEFLARNYDLEIEDEEFMEDYRKRWKDYED